MSIGSNTRRARQARPGLEGLEQRELLSGAGLVQSQGQGSPGPAVQVVHAEQSSGGGSSTKIPRVRQLRYTTAEGTRVAVTLYGVGSLFGSSLGPDGALNLRYSGTNSQTGIIARVHGGSGTAPLASVQHLLVPAQSLSGIGNSLLNVVNLRDFDLVPGGRVNLTGGVHILFLNSAAADTQISLRELPEEFQNQNATSANAVQNGVNLAFLTDLTGAQTLTGVGGTFVPGFNLLAAGSLPNPAADVVPQAAPPGVVVSITHVNGPARDAQGIGTPQVFAYDRTANALIRFDIGTGNATLNIPDALPPATAGTEAGVALGRANGRLVAMLNDGSNVYAFDPLNGAPVGHFSLDSLKAEGVWVDPSRLGALDTVTVVGDPRGGPNGLGVLQPIDVTQSLATGQAVATGPVYQSQRGFGLSGGLASLAGSATLSAAGGAHFDPYQPDQFQLGISSLVPNVPTFNGVVQTPSGPVIAVTPITFTETARNALTAGGATSPTDAHGGQPSSPHDALGTVDQFLALGTGLTTNASGQTVNAVTLISPTSFSAQGTVLLNDPNPLSALSASFRPDLAGVALVDVEGNTQSFRAKDARGLVFSGEGNVNLVKIDTAADTTIIGYPFGHAQIPNRSNVTILSSPRSVGDRNGVTVLTNIQPTGPLSLP
jgi:hypothetical protein